LPINRLRDALETETELSMAYISVPGLAVEPVVQRYKALEDSADNRRYLYKGVFRGFEGVIDIDRDGLVLKYSDTFDRLSASSQ
ncbi:MAG: putative glycolipid-binding domain-containing protein, partial [Hyphomicrobiales bacterium]